jgi:hypothetical protein
MSDGELRHLTPEQVVALVRRLEARIVELEAALAERGGPPKTPANSSVPPKPGLQAAGPPPGAQRAAAGAAVSWLPGRRRRRDGHGGLGLRGCGRGRRSWTGERRRHERPRTDDGLGSSPARGWGSDTWRARADRASARRG